MERNFIELNVLNVRDHGDAREKEIWPKVADALSQYESFWRTLVVLLTNRVVPNSSSEEWIRLRSTVPCAYERLAMHNYSLFYFAATARETIDEDHERLASDKFPHPERTFSALYAAAEHAKKLQCLAREILCGLDIHRKFPKHPERVYRKIRSYRRAFTHDPVLGRGFRHSRELLPPEERLPKTDKEPFLLWRQIASIPASEMIDGLELQDNLWQKLATFLQEQWVFLTEAFVEARKSGRFLNDLGLDNLLPITVTMHRSNPNTVGASGTTSLPAVSVALPK